MQSISDPTLRLRRSIAITGGLAGVLAVGCAWFAFKAPVSVGVVVPATNGKRSLVKEEPDPVPKLSMAGFERVQLWTSPPPEEAPVAAQVSQPVAPPPLRMDLVAIIRERGPGDTVVYAAAIYSQSEERVTVVRARERVGSYVVDGVTHTKVTLSMHGSQQILTLDQGAGTWPGESP